MRLELDKLICILFIPTIFTITFLLSALTSINSLGKSKTKRKKELRPVSAWKKVLLVGYVESCKCHIKVAQQLCKLYRLYIFILFLTLGSLVVANISTELYYFFQWLVLAKAILFDVPINVYSCVMTKHGKNGGVVWKWEE